ncbi:RDD family protein [Puniceicoccus vermicola]|uniref:RDD family protein n=1 Tax=Puniceicoccus vermicola TaxID=388746 RepID=A0A7X1E3Y2_9BACT|nr:RDD family protein [Puniceicoccus vermicola]MBC2601551.1 RDD family protein [Puniceicoccus vermicola]
MNEEPEIVEAEVVGEPEAPEFEPSSMGARFGALCLDLILLIAVFGLIATKVILPEWYPGAMNEFIELIEQYEDAGEDPAPLNPSSELMKAAQTINAIFFLSIFFYFTFVPLLIGGGTLGMRIFNLRIQQREADAPASFRAHLVRGAVKTVCLQILFPLLTLLFLFAFFNPQRAAIHDLLAKTRVVRGPAFSSK